MHFFPCSGKWIHKKNTCFKFRSSKIEALLIIYFSSLHSTYRTIVILILRAGVIATTGNSNLFILLLIGKLRSIYWTAQSLKQH